MSPEEKSRFDKLSQDDQLKLSAVMQLVQKEKDSKNNMKEDLDSSTYIDGLLDQPLVKQFVDTFEKIYADISQQGDFERNDVAQVLASYMIDRGSKWRAMNEDDRRTSQHPGIGQLHVQDAVQKEIKFHLDAYDKGTIDVDDLIQAIEDIIFGHVKAPGRRDEASGEIGVDQQGDTTRDINITNDTSMYDPLQEDLESLAKKSGIKLSDLLDKINDMKNQEKDQTEKEAFKGSALTALAEEKEQMKTIMASLRKNKGASDEEIKDFIRTHKDDIKDMTISEIEDEFDEFRSVNTDYVDESVEWFQKIGGIVPLTGIGNGGLM